MPRVRLAELIGTLSLAADAGTGMLEDHGLRTAVLAARLGASLGASSDECRAAYYLALLRYAGCTADAELASGVFGDEVEFARETCGIDYGDPREVVPALTPAPGVQREQGPESPASCLILYFMLNYVREPVVSWRHGR